jgi:hypothetical protein
VAARRTGAAGGARAKDRSVRYRGNALQRGNGPIGLQGICVGVEMILFSAIIVGGHLTVAVMDKIPDVTFEQLCKDAASGNIGINDSFDVCVKDEIAARDELARKWSEFEVADRTKCVRMSTSERIASYIELLTCLESAKYAKKLHPITTDTDDITGQISGTSKETVGAPTRHVVLSRHPAPGPPSPIESQPAPLWGILQLICLPGLKVVLPFCRVDGGR